MKILFICKGNYFRSQIAEALYNHRTNSNDAFSAGTYVGAPDEPEGQVLSHLLSPYLFKLMESRGMDIRNNRTKKLTRGMFEQAEIIVSMVEDPYIPDFLKNNKKVIWWDIKNPKHATPEFILETYNKLDALIRGLIATHHVEI